VLSKEDGEIGKLSVEFIVLPAGLKIQARVEIGGIRGIFAITQW
jgi:hypothetical protein